MIGDVQPAEAPCSVPSGRACSKSGGRPKLPSGVSVQPATTAKKARITSGPTITHGDSWAW